MVLFDFEHKEYSLPIIVSVPTPLPWPIQVPNLINENKSLALILEDFKRKKSKSLFYY